MKNRIYRWLYYCMSLLAGQAVCATPPPVAPKTAPYVQPGAPVFSDTIPLFREKFNLANPQLPLAEYRTVDTGQIQNVVVLAASRINRSVYSSAALEPGTGKIKTLQITWVPHRQADEKASRDLALHYMAALIRFFSPNFLNKTAPKNWNHYSGPQKGKPRILMPKAHCAMWLQNGKIKV